MTLRSAALITVLTSFTAYSLWVVAQVGYVGVFLSALDNPGSMQIGLDLCVSLTLLCGLLWTDARRHGLTVWPWLVAVPFVGSVAPLGYLLWREFRLTRAKAM